MCVCGDINVCVCACLSGVRDSVRARVCMCVKAEE